jgi:sporulation protein YlmC with PRC-barrel domain
MPATTQEGFMATVKDPSDTSGRLIAAEKVTGTTVYNRAGEKLGSVEDIMLDKMTGKTCYAILSFGGFLGIGGRYYPLPWEKLTYDTNLGGFVVDIDKRMLEDAPSYESGQNASWDDPAWGRRVDEHYGVSPYTDRTV